MKHVGFLGHLQIDAIVQIARIMAVNIVKFNDMFTPIDRNDISCKSSVLTSLHKYDIISYDKDTNTIIPNESTVSHYMIYYAYKICSSDLLDVSFSTINRVGSENVFSGVINGRKIIVIVSDAELVNILNYNK